MCQDIQQVTFFCGHQNKFWWGKSRFCLFKGEGASRFHTTYLAFARNNENCPRCQIVEYIKQQGKLLKRSEFKQMVEDRYEKTADFRQEQQAKKWESLSRKAHSELTGERIDDLELQIKESVAYYLYKDNCTPGSKVVLLRTLTTLPESFDVQELVRFFASRYFSEDNKERKLREWERTKLFSIARHARLDRTFKDGLNLKEPLPLPTRQGITDPALAMKSAQEKIEEGLANMAISPEAKDT
ncbi:hypothetical protein F4801DRAFT_578064 [Xylaria longipes]|nr:hypothetical protein F4801DRAFT_578064 [Xylaria longipes]RYC62885.1 hypothetical protein CHU98_g3339 [Xylaria longipes]